MPNYAPGNLNLKSCFHSPYDLIAKRILSCAPGFYFQDYSRDVWDVVYRNTFFICHNTAISIKSGIVNKMFEFCPI